MDKLTEATVALRKEDQIKMGGVWYYVTGYSVTVTGRYQVSLTAVENPGLSLDVYANSAAMFQIRRP